MDRKEFIRTSGRWMIFGIVTVFTAALIQRRQVSVSNNSCRISKGPCRDCAILASCTLPEAVKLKDDEKNKGI
jgi:hypothetical protein